MAKPIARLRCWKFFLEKDYLKCYNCAAKAMRLGAHVELIQLSIISLQRLRRDDYVQRQAPGLFSVIKHDPWFTLLLKFTLGEIDRQEVFGAAPDKKQLCQAYYYMYQRSLTLGDSRLAAEELALCLKQKAECIEFMLAEAEHEGRDSSHHLWKLLKELPEQ